MAAAQTRPTRNLATEGRAASAVRLFPSEAIARLGGGCSSVVEQLPRDETVGGSNPLTRPPNQTRQFRSYCRASEGARFFCPDSHAMILSVVQRPKCTTVYRAVSLGALSDNFSI